MLKVVVNRKFGGFSLSERAYERLIELGVPCQPETEPVNEGEVIIICTKKNRNYYRDTFLQENRAHPLLVQVVEELGQAANGLYARLEVVEIPPDVQWHIKEYDGNEWVAEDHRTW